eukprot:215341_1
MSLLEECPPIRNRSIDDVFYAAFFVSIIPVTYLCHVFYHRCLLKAVLKDDFEKMEIKTKFIGNTTNAVLVLQGVTVSTMITAVIVTTFLYTTYGVCDDSNNWNPNGYDYRLIFLWFGSFIGYFVIWFFDLKNNYIHLLHPDDTVKDKLIMLRKKYCRFMMYKALNMAIAASFIVPVYYSVVITEDGEHIGCICVVEGAADIALLGSITTIYFLFFPCIARCCCASFVGCCGNYLTTLVFLGSIMFILFRFSIYEKKINDLSLMGLQYQFDCGDLLLFWVTAMTLMFIIIHIVKCCKMCKENSEDEEEEDPDDGVKEDQMSQMDEDAKEDATLRELVVTNDTDVNNMRRRAHKRTRIVFNDSDEVTDVTDVREQFIMCVKKSKLHSNKMQFVLILLNIHSLDPS